MSTWRRPEVICLALALAAAVTYLAVDARTRADHLRQVSEIRVGGSPALDDGSPRDRRGPIPHSQILSLSGADGYQWILHAGEMQRRHGWRIHHTAVDNFPEGREVHWSAAPSWWLRCLAAVLPGAGASGGERLGRAALLAGPIQYIGLIVLLALLVRRRFGWEAACALPLAVFLSPRLDEFFQAGYMDHHGLASFAGLAATLFAAASGAGWVRVDEASPETPAARRWMLASAVAGAIGLWVSSASAVPVLVGIGLGALLAARQPGRTEDASIRFQPELWRLWGWAGAAGSLAFYLLECFPTSMGMRLEVNHPLYALAWAGGGELLFRGCRRIHGGRLLDGGRDRIIVLAALAALAALPALIVISPDTFFWVSDRFLWLLHRDIGEFQPVTAMIRQYGLATTVRANSLLPLLAIPVAITLLRSKRSSREKGMLAVTLLPALIVWILAWIQVRWAGNQEALWLGVLCVWLSLTFSANPALPAWSRGATAAFLSLAILSAWPATVGATLARRQARLQVTIDDQLQLVMRDVAQQLHRRAGDDPIVVLSGPSATTEMIYFGGLQGIGTLYWENRAGLRAAAAIAGSSTDDEALAEITQRRITHLVSYSWERYDEQLARLDRAERGDLRGGPSFAERIRSPLALPVWLRPIPYTIPSELGLKGHEVSILEVHPEETAAEHLAYVGDLLARRGETAQAAESYRRALALANDNARAAVGLARTLVAAGDLAEVPRLLDSPSLRPPADNAADVANETARIGAQISSRDPATAVRLYRRAIDFDPRCRIAWNNLAWMLATSPDPAVRNGPEAVRAAASLAALDLEPDPITLDTVAAAYAEAGRWSEAVSAAEQAVDLAGRRGLRERDELQGRLELYRAGQPFRQPRRTN